jgi:hypothetical protein
MIDFSHYSCTEGLLNFAVSKKIPTVIATTGLMAEQTAMIRRAAGSIPVFFSANMSIGVNLMLHLVRQAARVLEGDFDNRGDREAPQPEADARAERPSPLSTPFPPSSLLSRNTNTTAIPSGKSAGRMKSASTPYGAAPSWGNTRFFSRPGRGP